MVNSKTEKWQMSDNVVYVNFSDLAGGFYKLLEVVVVSFRLIATKTSSRY